MDMIYLYGGSIDTAQNGNYFGDLWAYSIDTNLWAWLSGDNSKVRRGHLLQRLVHTLHPPGARHWIARKRALPRG